MTLMTRRAFVTLPALATGRRKRRHKMGMQPDQQGVFFQLIIQGGGEFTYDAAGNLRTANVGQTTTDPLQGITCYAGFSTFNGFGAVISLFSSTLDAQLWYTDSASSSQGALAASVSSQSGTDPFGNAFKAGVSTYGSGVFAEMNGAELDLSSTAAATRITFAGRIYLKDATTDAANPVTEIASPFTAVSSLVKRLSVQLRGESKDGTAPAQLLIAADGNSEQAPVTGALVEVQGTAAANRLDVAPAATAPPARPAGTEPWNAMVLVNGWANSGVPAQYRLIASPPASIEIIGSLLSAGSTAATIFTLPAAYRPAHTIRFPVELIVGTAPAAGTNMFGSVAATGAIGLFNIPTVAGDIVDFHALIPLDA